MVPSKGGSLGRGLGELIGGIPATIGSAATISSTGFVRLSPDLIGLPPERAEQAQNVSAELVESVRIHGILQPILVRRRTQGYEVVVGARRLVAARLAGLKEVPAVVVQATDEEGAELSKVENTCRESGSPLTAVAPNEVADPVAVPVPVAESRPWWTPVRMAAACGLAVLLVIAGTAVGFGLGGRSVGGPLDAPVSEPVQAVVSPMVIPEPVAVAAQPEPPQPELDVSDFKALESDGVTCVVDDNGIARVTFGAPIFSSRAALAEEGTLVLKKLGAILVAHEAAWAVAVTGHTDAVPLRGSGIYRDNKELGLARAAEVVRYLMREAKVPATMLSAATAGDENPPYPGDDADSRRKNRTVTLGIALR